MDGPELFPTEEGTPQGGAISPLLANVALHGLETAVRAAFPDGSRGRTAGTPLVVRYADDFVVLHEDLAVIEQARTVVSAWLAGMGLELKASKTRITHTLAVYDGHVGFDFLGWTVRQFPVGRTHRGRAGLGFKTIVKPSNDAQKRHLADIAGMMRRHQQSPVKALIQHLNPKVRGWAAYHSHQVSKRVFGRSDHLIYLKLKRWAERRHPQKSRSWARNHYWHTRGDRNWVFGPREGVPLARHADTPIVRHVKVRGDKSPYDGDLLYWASRLGRHPELPPGKAALLKAQRGRCARCGLLFLSPEELIEVDHRTPRRFGGVHGDGNRQLLHGHCHDQKTAADGSLVARGHREVPVTRAKRRMPCEHPNTVEEPDEGKPSRPVL